MILSWSNYILSLVLVRVSLVLYAPQFPTVTTYLVDVEFEQCPKFELEQSTMLKIEHITIFERLWVPPPNSYSSETETSTMDFTFLIMSNNWKRDTKISTYHATHTSRQKGE